MKFVLRLVLKAFDWEFLFETLIQFANELIKEWLEQEDLNRKQKMFIQMIDVLNRTLGKTWSLETPSKIDDLLVSELEEAAEHAAEEHEFELHTISEI